MRTDAHLHLWDLQESGYGWLQHAAEGLRRTVRWEDIRDAQTARGITRVILVQADDTAEDTAHLQREAARIEGDDSPITTADVVGWLPLEDPDRVTELLAAPAAIQRLVGVRHLIHDHPDAGFLERKAVQASLALLADAGLALDVPDAFDRHMEQTCRIADRHPRLRIVLDHLGKPPLGDHTAMRRWERLLRVIAHRPNVTAKLSGLSTSGDGEFESAVELALKLFGPERLMFGSDWPIAPTPLDAVSGSGRLLERIERESADAQAQVLGETAARVYRRIA